MYYYTGSHNLGLVKHVASNIKGSSQTVKDIKISRDSLSKPFIYKKKLFIIKNGAIVQYE